MSKILAKCELRLNATIEHTEDMDNINISFECIGRTSPEGFRKLILDSIEKLIVEYQKNRKDIFIKSKRDK